MVPYSLAVLALRRPNVALALVIVAALAVSGPIITAKRAMIVKELMNLAERDNLFIIFYIL